MKRKRQTENENEKTALKNKQNKYNKNFVVKWKGLFKSYYNRHTIFQWKRIKCEYIDKR